MHDAYNSNLSNLYGLHRKLNNCLLFGIQVEQHNQNANYTIPYWPQTCTHSHAHTHARTGASLIVCAKFQFDGVYCSIILTSSKRMKTKPKKKNGNVCHSTVKQSALLAPTWLANVFQAHFRRNLQFMSIFHIEINTKCETSKIQPNFSIIIHILPDAAIVFICAQQISLYELLILFGMHLKCLWMILLFCSLWLDDGNFIYASMHFNIETSTLCFKCWFYSTFQPHIHSTHCMALSIKLAYHNPAVNLAH